MDDRTPTDRSEMTTPQDRDTADPTGARTDDDASATARHQRADDPDGSLAVLDEPLDRRGIAELLNRPGLARSTRRLIVVLAVVVVFALGAVLGRATAPAPRSPQDPPLSGTVESVDPVAGGTVLTLRGADGTLTAVRTGAGTRVATVRADGPTSLGRGVAVDVGAVQADDGSLTATRIDVLPG